jgi:hypothetical protein
MSAGQIQYEFIEKTHVLGFFVSLRMTYVIILSICERSLFWSSRACPGISCMSGDGIPAYAGMTKEAGMAGHGVLQQHVSSRASVNDLASCHPGRVPRSHNVTSGDSSMRWNDK